MSDLSREQKLELYRFMRLNRVVEERLVNLYRQGKVVGGLYRSLGQEATSVGSAYALAKGDVVGPADPEPRRRSGHGLLPARRHDAVHGARHVAVRRQGLQSPLRQPRARRDLPHLDARRAGPGHGGHRARRPHAEEGPRRHDVDRRRRDLDGRVPRGPQLRRGPEAAARRHRGEQRLGVLDAVPQADRRALPRGQGRGLRDPGRPGGRQRRPRRVRRGAPRRRPGAVRRRADAHRGDDVPHEGPRRARRPGVRAQGRARGVARKDPIERYSRTLVESGAAAAGDLEAIDSAVGRGGRPRGRGSPRRARCPRPTRRCAASTRRRRRRRSP